MTLTLHTLCMGVEHGERLYFSREGPRGQPLTNETFQHARFFASKSVAEARCKLFNSEWNTNFVVLSYEVKEL